MIKAIIFDFGRVISAQKPPSLFAGYEADLGLEPGTINVIMFDSQAWQEALIGRKTEEEFWRVIGPKLGLDAAKDIDAFRRRYRADERINSEVVDLMNRLNGHYKLALLSNSPPGLIAWLTEWEVLGLFDVVFCSGDEGVAKPGAAAFEMTLKRLNVKPAEAVFIDDAVENVESAKALGLHGVLFTDTRALETELKNLLKDASLKSPVLG
jgi:putative hydrolase of the HAD superfamily